MNIFIISIYIISVVYMTLNFRHDIHMLQQNSYRLGRYWRYLKKSDIGNTSRLIDIALLFSLFSTLIDSRLSCLLIGIVFICKILRILKLKFKKPLVFTSRVMRIYSVTILIGLGSFSTVAILTWGKSDLWGGYSFPVLSLGTLLLITVFSWFVAMLSIIALKPVEHIIDRKYRNEASAILQGMPDLKIIGITGSYGKTSTKHYLHRILSEKYQVVMTPGSYNTPMGVIRTIREIMKPYDQIFICEMGAKQKGDIKEICDLVHPSVGIITAVGPMHLETFKTIENVQSTKFELIDSLPDNGFAVINNDWEFCANRLVENISQIRYSISQNSDSEYIADNIHYTKDGTSFTIKDKNGYELNLTTRLVGDCNISNLIAAVIVAKYFNIDDQSIQRGVAAIEQVEHRLSIRQTPGGVVIIDDAFNSNPAGAKMALKVLSEMKGGKRIIVTPGMIELGNLQTTLNEEFGKSIAMNADIAIIVGQYNRDSIMHGMIIGGMPETAIHVVDSFSDAQNILADLISAGDTILYENDLPDSFN